MSALSIIPISSFLCHKLSERPSKQLGSRVVEGLIQYVTTQAFDVRV